MGLHRASARLGPAHRSFPGAAAARGETVLGLIPASLSIPSSCGRMWSGDLTVLSTQEMLAC